MKKKGTLIAVLFLLVAIGTATLAGLQSCGHTETTDGSLTRVSTKAKSTVQTSDSRPGTGSADPVTSGSDTPKTDASSGTDPQTTPVISSTQPASTPSTSATTPSTPPSSGPETTPSTPQTTEPSVPQPTVPSGMGFVADLSAYEKYMNPTGSAWDDAYLLLVNADHPIGKDAELTYSALNKIVKFSKITAYNHEKYKPGQQLNEVAMQALTAMFIEAKAEGVPNLYATSAHRTYTYQVSLFNNNVNKTNRWSCQNCGNIWIGKSSKCDACGTTSTTTLPVTKEEKEANVATYSCRPGTSDHQTGLAVDIIQSSLPSEYLSLIQAFGDTAAGKWLAANAHKFGFILRFPADKEDITGIIYEPWHFRFVGREHATFMYENNLCLEEYVEYLTQTGYFAN